MLDLKAIAAARAMNIPDDQIARIAPVMQRLDDDLRRVLEKFPEAPDCAISFDAGGEEL
jgi:hypothetical protein